MIDSIDSNINNTIQQGFKDYRRCYRCKALITYRSNIADNHGRAIPLDLNHKRHICSSADRVIHEEKVVKEIKDRIDKVNQVELLSFQLTLGME
jgi:hypothetical protein